MWLQVLTGWPQAFDRDSEGSANIEYANDVPLLPGERGGARVIYYYHHRGPVIFLLLVYAKSRQDDLTAHQKKQLRALVQKEFK